MNTLTAEITAKEPSLLKVKVSHETEIILQNFSITSIVAVIKEVFMKGALETVRQILEGLDALLMKEAGQNFGVTKKEKRTLKTSIGKLNFYCRYGYEKGKHRVPLLEFIGVKKYQRMTDDGKELGNLASLFTSFRKALRIAGFCCSLATLWKNVQKSGKVYRKRVDDVLYYYSEGEPCYSAHPKDFAVVMMDEIWLRRREKRKFLMVKTARLVVARYKEESYHFEPLRVFASGVLSQEAFVKKASRFFDAVSGLNAIQHIMVLTDGCSMGKNFCELYPGRAVWQLDWWHLWNYVHNACKFEKDFEQEIWGLLMVEKRDEALVLLQLYLDVMKEIENKLKEFEKQITANGKPLVKPKIFWNARQREHIEKLISYLKKNRDGIYGVKAFQGKVPAEYLAFGSGPVERLQAVMIAYRMKKQGKHWTVEGAENLVTLLTKEWNGEEVEAVLQQALGELDEWERSCLKDALEVPDEEEIPKKKKCHSRPFCVEPRSTLTILQRGKVESFYHPLYEIAHLKNIPHVVERVERGDLLTTAA